MYSPKISEDLIPLIYRNSKEDKIPMTTYVNRVLRDHLFEIEKSKSNSEEEKEN